MPAHTSAEKHPSKVAARRRTFLAGNSSISLQGSEEQLNVFQIAILKNGFRKPYSCFVVVFSSFSQNFPLRAPEFQSCVSDTSIQSCALYVFVIINSRYKQMNNRFFHIPPNYVGCWPSSTIFVSIR